MVENEEKGLMKLVGWNDEPIVEAIAVSTSAEDVESAGDQVAESAGPVVAEAEFVAVAWEQGAKVRLRGGNLPEGRIVSIFPEGIVYAEFPLDNVSRGAGDGVVLRLLPEQVELVI